MNINLFKQLHFFCACAKINKIFLRESFGLKEVVVKTALKTLLAVIIALVLAFGIVSLAYPGGMANICENTGNYSMAVSYCSLAYKYSGKVEDLARCAEDSIFAKNDKKIEKYCSELLQHKDFENLCAEKSGNLNLGGVQLTLDYKQYIRDNLEAAQARLNGN